MSLLLLALETAATALALAPLPRLILPIAGATVPGDSDTDSRPLIGTRAASPAASASGGSGYDRGSGGPVTSPVSSLFAAFSADPAFPPLAAPLPVGAAIATPATASSQASGRTSGAAALSGLLGYPLRVDTDPAVASATGTCTDSPLSDPLVTRGVWTAAAPVGSGESAVGASEAVPLQSARLLRWRAIHAALLWFEGEPRSARSTSGRFGAPSVESPSSSLRLVPAPAAPLAVPPHSTFSFPPSSLAGADEQRGGITWRSSCPPPRLFFFQKSTGLC